MTGANDTFKAQLAQPDDLFGSLGVTEAEVAQELSERPRIAVFGAGAVRNSYLASLTNQEQPPSTVVVVAAGSVRDFRLSMLQEEHAAIEAAISIDVTGAGSVRDVGLMWATFE